MSPNRKRSHECKECARGRAEYTEIERPSEENGVYGLHNLWIVDSESRIVLLVEHLMWKVKGMNHQADGGALKLSTIAVGISTYDPKI